MDKARSFFENAKLLNEAFGVSPLLYGSLGLEYLTGENLNADDIDILIPRRFISENWPELCALLNTYGYTLVDEHEHEFEKDGVFYAYAAIDGMEDFAGIPVAEIAEHQNEKARFKLLTLEQYLKVYRASAKDGYRVYVREKKDNEKIAFIQKHLNRQNEKEETYRNNMSEPAAVQQQYKTANNLNTRISIHHKYSTNPQSFGDWIFENYDLAPGFKILELGCGTGEMWTNHAKDLPQGASLLLTDFSAGMLETAQNNLSHAEKITFAAVDIQNIPYPDRSFDAVIANMMLYHVPDLDKALAEVRRVLKPGGTFYCATYGETSIARHLCSLLEDFELATQLNKNFTLQNGGETLQRHFASVERRDREDALAVTDIHDIVDYLYSLASMYNLKPENRDAITDTLTAQMQNGVLYIPKEYGMFVCR